ncbi:response regulator [Ferruginibacter paludis]|uniref:response regulator n=1 Tax=Ferruginibacter paludis TaxID=1310417 RepID=UPI0025B48D60|nr:response regulator [Ferruginibacter paludis]MDN3654428.1 response regulator [Ferruginibacter paludis]
MTTLDVKQIDVLIIDDEKDICYLLGNLLRKKRLQSEYVNSLKDAASMLEKNEPEIIFLDNHLPDGLGVNFISYIKRFHPLSKIIMITAHDNVADKQKAFKEGVDYFLSKPFSKETINGIMETLAH